MPRDHESSLETALATPESKSRYVRRLFSTIAERYDLITVLLSFGLDRRWKRRLVEFAKPLRGSCALDLACGTGDIAFELAARGTAVVGLDVTDRMLQIARAKPAGPSVRWIRGDMMALPFGDERFDVVTTGYGIRNVPDIGAALDEIRRVLKPGGLLLSLDFNRPAHPLARAIYLAYLSIVGSALGWILHRDPDTYRYIPETIRRYPGARAVAAMLEARGFEDSSYVPVLAGFMAINTATRKR